MKHKPKALQTSLHFKRTGSTACVLVSGSSTLNQSNTISLLCPSDEFTSQFNFFFTLVFASTLWSVVSFTTQTLNHKLLYLEDDILMTIAFQSIFRAIHTNECTKVSCELQELGVGLCRLKLLCLRGCRQCRACYLQ